MEYKIGDKLEVATRMLTHEIPYETKDLIIQLIWGLSFLKHDIKAGIYQKDRNIRDIESIQDTANKLFEKMEGIK